MSGTYYGSFLLFNILSDRDNIILGSGTLDDYDIVTISHVNASDCMFYIADKHQSAITQKQQTFCLLDNNATIAGISESEGEILSIEIPIHSSSSDTVEAIFISIAIICFVWSFVASMLFAIYLLVFTFTKIRIYLPFNFNIIKYLIYCRDCLKNKLRQS